MPIRTEKWSRRTGQMLSCHPLDQGAGDNERNQQTLHVLSHLTRDSWTHITRRSREVGVTMVRLSKARAPMAAHVLKSTAVKV